MSNNGPILNLNKHVLRNWQKAEESEVMRTKSVVLKYFETITKIEEKNFFEYRVTTTVQQKGDYSFLIISPLKRVFILLLDKDLRVVFASHVMKRKFESKKDKDMRQSSPLDLENGYKLMIGENKLFSILDQKNQQVDLLWLHNIPLFNGDTFDISSKWTDVDQDEEKNAESKFILHQPAQILQGKTWQRVINIICDHYGYWDVKYFLVDCEGKQCIDLNTSDHYHGMGSNYDAIWIEENNLVGYRHEGGEMIEENVQLFPQEKNDLLKDMLFKSLFQMSTGIDGQTIFSHNLDREFDTAEFVKEFPEN